MGELFDLTGKVAIITGSSRGIGKAIAERMAEHGARVVISSRKQDACDAVAAEINVRYPGCALAVAANISDKEGLQHLVDETKRAFGQVDILVCNAASNPYYGPMEGIADEQFRKILDNNIVANHWLISMVAPEMRARKDGAIVIISSIGGIRGTSVLGAYGISKAADMALARNLAHEFGPDNVRVNCIAPGLIKTDFARALWENPETLKRSTQGAPLRRIGEPDEIAGAAVFLAAPAGSFMTGQTIVIDGGADDMMLAGKVAIVTGAGSGIGRATARRFAQEGAKLVIGDKSEGVHETATLIGGDVVAVQMDAGSETDVEALVATALDRFDDLDIAFANAGISGGITGIFDHTVADWQAILQVNLIGPFLMIKHAGRVMMERRKGSIVCTASVAGIRSGAGCPAYSASKAGVINLVKTAAQQLSATNVRVNAICPGLIQTGMTQRAFDYATEKGVTDKIGRLNPLRRAGQPDEIANMALFLASDEASYVNGQAIAVDGGLSSSHPVTRQETGKTAA